MSQAELAERMSNVGFKFHDSTITAIEKGRRRVSLDEAEVLSRILGVDIGYMTSTDYPADIRAWIDAKHERALDIRKRNDPQA